MTDAPAAAPHIMLDLETFGNGNEAAIVSIGAVKFNETDIFDQFHVGVDLGSAMAVGMKVDSSTVDWWMHPDQREALDTLRGLDKVDIASALIGFKDWAGDNIAAIWGNGATFDNIILRSAYRLCGLEYPVRFWQDQCYRTMKYRAPEITLVREGVHHDACDDARCQAKHLQAIVAHLGVCL